MSRRCFCQRTVCSSRIPPHQQALTPSMAAIQAWVTYPLLPPEWETYESAETGKRIPTASGFAPWASATGVGHGLFAWFLNHYYCSTLSSRPDPWELYLLWPLASGSLLTCFSVNCCPDTGLSNGTCSLGPRSSANSSWPILLIIIPYGLSLGSCLYNRDAYNHLVSFCFTYF